MTLEQRLRAAWRALRDRVGEPPETLDIRERVAIADLRPGQEAMVVGRVRCFDEPQLVAPLSGRRCAYYRARLFDKVSGDVIEEAGMQSFHLADETGEVLVKVEEPIVHLAMDAHVSVGVLRPFDDKTQEFLAKHGRPSQRWWLERDVRFEEGRIDHDEAIAVLGRARRARSGAAVFHGYREATSSLVLDAPVGGRLAIADVLRDD